MKYRKKPVVIEAYQTDKELDIETLEGTMHASVGDYIITGVRGEQYPCKPDIFEQTYEPADTSTVDAVPVVFINDPFHVVYQAFKELYPDKECEIMFDYNVETTDTHERVKGVTIFPDDGSIPQIRIDCEQTIDQISGILAHELAHVALGKPEWDDRELDHGEDFEKVLDAIFDRFNELQGFCADGERRTDEQ